MKIAILGTGRVGNALGTKLVQIGNEVTMGSRNTGRMKRLKNGPVRVSITLRAQLL